MAAEKLTTGRLIQILVVMTVLITAFIWRTLEHSDEKNKQECLLVAGSCSVTVHGDTVDIKLEDQKNGLQFLVVKTAREPQSLSVLSKPERVISFQKFDALEGEKEAYFYALENDVNSALSQKMILNIDHNQIEINF